MIKVKTFTSAIRIFQAMEELNQLDEQVNRFIAEKGIKKVITVSDACTTDDSGATMGIIRTVTYED
jgi:predicted GTPase